MNQELKQKWIQLLQCNNQWYKKGESLMSELKPGDKVKCVQGEKQTIVKGQTYTIKENFGNGLVSITQNGQGVWHQDRFEKLYTPKFQKGDKIISKMTGIEGIAECDSYFVGNEEFVKLQQSKLVQSTYVVSAGHFNKVVDSFTNKPTFAPTFRKGDVLGWKAKNHSNKTFILQKDSYMRDDGQELISLPQPNPDGNGNSERFVSAFQKEQFAPKFKKGDIVKCGDAKYYCDSDSYIRQDYMIEAVDFTHIKNKTKYIGQNVSVYEKCPFEPKFKKGDRIKLINYKEVYTCDKDSYISPCLYNNGMEVVDFTLADGRSYEGENTASYEKCPPEPKFTPKFRKGDLFKTLSNHVFRADEDSKLNPNDWIQGEGVKLTVIGMEINGKMQKTDLSIGWCGMNGLTKITQEEADKIMFVPKFKKGDYLKTPAYYWQALTDSYQDNGEWVDAQSYEKGHISTSLTRCRVSDFTKITKEEFDKEMKTSFVPKFKQGQLFFNQDKTKIYRAKYDSQLNTLGEEDVTVQMVNCEHHSGYTFQIKQLIPFYAIQGAY